MKSIKSRMIYFTGICILGIIFILISLIFKFENSSVFTIGAGFAGIGAIRLYQYNKISKDSKKLEDYNIKQNEERLVFLALKSGNLTFIMMMMIEFVGIIVLMIMKQEYLVNVISFIAFTSLGLYLIIYFIYYKKY